MNVLALLDEELKGKNWTLTEKERYLFLRSCALFSYDPKYDFYNILPATERKKKKQEIRNRTINLEDVDDFNVVCTSHSWYVYAELLSQILNVPCEKHFFANHGWCTFHDGVRKIEADSTTGFDIGRVKMNLSTNHYVPVDMEENSNALFKQELKEIDKKIGYIEEDYYEVSIQNKKDYLERIVQSKNLTKDEQLLYKMNVIKNIFEEEQPLFTNYSDAEFCAEYLQIKLLEGNELLKVKDVPLFLDYDDKPWEFVKIYPVYLTDDKTFFLLEQDPEKKGYSLREVKREEAKSRVLAMKGYKEEKVKVLY